MLREAGHIIMRSAVLRQAQESGVHPLWAAENPDFVCMPVLAGKLYSSVLGGPA